MRRERKRETKEQERGRKSSRDVQGRTGTRNSFVRDRCTHKECKKKNREERENYNKTVKGRRLGFQRDQRDLTGRKEGQQGAEVTEWLFPSANLMC